MLKSKLVYYDKVLHDDGLVVWYEKESEEIVGMVSLKPQRSQTWICSLYVSPRYRGLGICRALLDYATFSGGDHLSVRKSSQAALIYQHYGFNVYDEDDEFLYMAIKPESDSNTTDKTTKEICGYWIESEGFSNDTCSICGKQADAMGCNYNYCPHCGYPMNLKEVIE